MSKFTADAAADAAAEGRAFEGAGWRPLNQGRPFYLHPAARDGERRTVAQAVTPAPAGFFEWWWHDGHIRPPLGYARWWSFMEARGGVWIDVPPPSAES